MVQERRFFLLTGGRSDLDAYPHLVSVFVHVLRSTSVARRCGNTGSYAVEFGNLVEQIEIMVSWLFN